MPQIAGGVQVKMTPSTPSTHRKMLRPPSGSQRTLPSDVGAQWSPTELPVVSQSAVSLVTEHPLGPLQSA